MALDFSSRLHDDMADARYNSKKSLIDSAKDYVHRNYRSVDLGLDDTCKELGVSNSYFSSLFKKETGKTPQGYIQEKVIELAKERMSDRRETVSRVAYSLGFRISAAFLPVVQEACGLYTE